MSEHPPAAQWTPEHVRGDDVGGESRICHSLPFVTHTTNPALYAPT